MSTYYGIASIAFGVFILASGVYALVAHKSVKTFVLALVAAAIIVAFGVWMLGQ